MTLGLSTGFTKVTGYVLYCNETGVFTPKVVLTNSTVTSYQTTDVVQGKIYYYKIAALNIYGEGVSSSIISVSAAAVPVAPYNITLISADETHITITWTESFNGGS